MQTIVLRPHRARSAVQQTALALVALSSLGCRATSAARSPPAAPTGASRAPSESVAIDAPRVRARAPRAIARCEAGEITTLASTSREVGAEAALARSERGALVAFITRSPQGERVLNVLALDDRGRPLGAPRALAGAREPSAPALVALDDGYVIAFREHVATLNPILEQERIVLLELARDGSIARWRGHRQTLGPSSALREAVAIDDTATHRGFGAPALTVHEGRVALAAVRGRFVVGVSELYTVEDVTGSWREQSRALDSSVRSTVAPSALYEGSTLRVLLEANTLQGGTELLAARGAEPVTKLLTDAVSPSMLRTPRGTLLGYSTFDRVSNTVRARSLADEPELAPSTLAVFAPMSRSEVALVSLGEDLVGAITLSHMTDDATGSLNLSLMDTRGAFIGRFAAMTSLRLRSSRVVAASVGNNAWTVVDGRADDGTAVLGLITITCDERREQSAQALPTATMLQEPSPPDEAPSTLERPGNLALCESVGQPTLLSTHVPEGEDSTAGQSWRSTTMPDGRIVLFAFRRVSAERTEMVAVAARPDGSTQQLGAIAEPADSMRYLLDAGSIRGTPYAITSDTTFTVGRAGLQPVPGAEVLGSSARLVRGGTGAVFVRREHLGHRFVYVSLADRRPARPVPLTRFYPQYEKIKENLVLDAVAVGNTVHALLAQRSIGGMAIVRTVLSFDASPRALSERAARGTTSDPFADPLSIGGEGGALVSDGRTLTLLWNHGSILRAGRIERGTLFDLRSLFDARAPGGRVLAARSTSADAIAITTTPGVLPNSDDSAQLRYVITAHGADGSPRALSLRMPRDASAFTQIAEGHAIGDQLAVVYARPQPNGSLQWLAQRAQCNTTPTSATRAGATR
jgi:hypothetical protein